MENTSNMTPGTPSEALATGFVLGTVAGAAFHLVRGPRKEAFRRGLHLGAELGVFGGVLSIFGSYSTAFRKKDDLWNFVYAAALSEGLLQLKDRSTLRSAAFSAVGMGMFAVPYFWGANKLFNKKIEAKQE